MYLGQVGLLGGQVGSLSRVLAKVKQLDGVASERGQQLGPGLPQWRRVLGGGAGARPGDLAIDDDK